MSSPARGSGGIPERLVKGAALPKSYRGRLRIWPVAIGGSGQYRPTVIRNAVMRRAGWSAIGKRRSTSPGFPDTRASPPPCPSGGSTIYERI
jgi:hypothetical protein